ncbi:MAG: hypothetical protein E7291_08295 [Lachnospiraceae bacterium]|nr:hypothetical protein [Lachnospiraceae bacterium]
MNKNTLEITALQLKALLTALSAVDPDNTEALAELPNALKPAAGLAEIIYCMVADGESVEK